MAETFGEWRRARSPTSGALVLWLRDLVPGPGWGVLDHTGEPKVAWHHLRRALASVAVWTTDEGLGGVDVHVANDRPERLAAQFRVALYRDFEHLVDEAIAPLELLGHETVTRNVEDLLGRFVDASWAYRFGPPGHHAIVASLESAGALLSQAVRFPVGRPSQPEPAARLGLEATSTPRPDGSVAAVVGTKRLAYCVRVQAHGFLPSEDAFCVEPDHPRTVLLRPREEGIAFAGAYLTALNLEGQVHVAPGDSA
jgi:beta-mannosidase